MIDVLCPEGCTSPDMGRLLESYLNGELTEDKAEAFENHYFGCAACLGAIRVRQSGPHAFARWKLLSDGRNWLRLGLIAAALVVAATLYVMCGHGLSGPFVRNSGSSFAELSRVTPPSYAPSIVDGSDDESRQSFVEAMKSYSTNDLGRAVVGLEESWKGDHSRAETGFYLGASYLMSNRVDRAIETLRTTIALGESSFLDRSRILLARRTSGGNVDHALRELREVRDPIHDEAERLFEGITHARNERR